MTIHLKAATAVAFAMVATVSNADTGRIAAGLSLFGPTIDAQIPLSENITVRGSLAGGLSASGSTTIDGLDYTLSGELGATSLSASYHLPAGFRLSGGVVMSNSSFSGSVTGSAGDTVGGVVVPQAFQISSSASFVNQLSPSVTLGFDVPIFGMVLSTDAGIMKTGGLDISLVETTAGGNVIPPADLAAAEAQMKSNLANYDILPFASVMIGKWF